MRGNGTAAWRSAHEVWSERFGFRDPGFDPLATAVAAAHARGMQLHAWVNVVPGWVGVEEPADERQLWNSRRDWFLQDANGEHQSRKKGKYLALDPARAARAGRPGGAGDAQALRQAQTRAVTELVAAIRAAVKASGKPILLGASACSTTARCSVR